MDLLFGIHCHQPFNNFYEIVQEATEKSYLPFLKELLEFPNIKINVHYSGWLFKWIKEHRKDTFNILKKLSNKGQIEFFVSGFYEPVLSILPERDAEIQIKKSLEFIKNNFGKDARGLWLTERVWEDKLIKLLVNCGIQYVVVDDYHFFAAGFKKQDIFGYYLTESEGEPLGIFPINKELRYLIPFKNVNDIVNYLEKISCGIIFDDGEKFGLWPKTFEWVYEKGWLNDFFTALEHEKDINTLTFEKFFKENKPLGRAYLPEVSYYEMGEWALNYEAALNISNLTKRKKIPENFIRTGIWKNFFIKYEESNNIHKRVLELSKDVHSSDSANEALEYLLQSECNDCLWHGVFGGVYLPILRNNAYIAINKAENVLKKGFHDNSEPVIKDINFDGYNEIIFRNGYFTVMASAKFGGAIYEFSERDSCFNIMNTLMRRKETYHDSMLKHEEHKTNNKGIATIHEMDYTVNKELKDALVFDKHLKYSFIHKFFKKEESFLNYKLCKYEELSNFIGKDFKFNKDNATFNGEGELSLFNSSFPVLISKQYEINDNIFSADITLTNNSYLPFDLKYCLELNFFFPGHNDKESYMETGDKKVSIESELNIEEIKRIKIFDNVIGKNIIIEATEEFTLWMYPFYTVSKSEKGFEKIYQGNTFGLLFPFDLFCEEVRKHKITIKVF